MATIDNYQALREQWRQRFLGMDHEHLARRFNLKLDENRLYVTYFSHPFALERGTGEVVRLDMPDKAVTFDTALMFYTMFHYAVEYPKPSGVLVPFRDVKRVYPFESAYRNSILMPMAERFNGRAEQLDRACRALKGTPVNQADVGYELECLPGLKVAVLFWDGDEEFSAQTNMLFDSNITDFMHEENVVSVAADALYYLTEASDGDAVSVYEKSSDKN